ncbi:MAG: hypothetical protein Q8N10_08870 [Phenylobacterium sp.]|nr:hypothetical protein [Phenylobacterium sp.]MDO8912521.1 hypothetical protein [Phenylobacterium sp.]MDP3100599.1 hypothetical protein [Phenylobacterium sp.]
MDTALVIRIGFSPLSASIVRKARSWKPSSSERAVGPVSRTRAARRRLMSGLSVSASISAFQAGQSRPISAALKTFWQRLSTSAQPLSLPSQRSRSAGWVAARAGAL